jgi:hypothetical protein
MTEKHATISREDEATDRLERCDIRKVLNSLIVVASVVRVVVIALIFQERRFFNFDVYNLARGEVNTGENY